MKQRTIMIKPSSALCNMRCRYCFYFDVSERRAEAANTLMTREAARCVIENALFGAKKGDLLTFAFQGGEPSLAGLDFFRDFTTYAKAQAKSYGVTLSYSFQTNGLLIDEDWCDFFKENNVLVGLSLDGPFHDRNRLDASGKGTASRVLKAKRLLEQRQIAYNILCVLTSETAQHPEKLWKFLLQNMIRYVQFIPCLGELVPIKEEPYRLKAERFASFYTTLFRLWRTEFDRGNYVSVKLFDDLVNLLALGQVNACGLTGQCSVQCVVESDGSVYPCDFYALDEYRMGFLTQSPPEELTFGDAGRRFLQKENKRPALCKSCPYDRFCGGGCKRMSREVYAGEDGVFCGMRTFFDSCIGGLLEVGKKLYG